VKNIVVPIDFSAVTPHVIELAVRLATSFTAEIHLVHVNELSPAIPPAALGYGAAGVPEFIPTLPVAEVLPQPSLPSEKEKARLAEWQKEIARTGVKVTLHEPTGEVTEEILRIANATKADLIVMGRHGHGAVYNLLVGSVTHGVLKRADRPVLLVPTS
jgi:nucleotide-binding universal stress UspA family protein